MLGRFIMVFMSGIQCACCGFFLPDFSADENFGTEITAPMSFTRAMPAHVPTQTNSVHDRFEKILCQRKTVFCSCKLKSFRKKNRKFGSEVMAITSFSYAMCPPASVQSNSVSAMNAKKKIYKKKALA